MATAIGMRVDEVKLADGVATMPAGGVAVSWPAIVAGAFVAAGVSVIFFVLGAGLGLASVSPWTNQGVSGTAFTITAAIWLVVTQWVCAALGGYIAGRLRSRWLGTHVHEVFFRDTAHGLVTWAVATVLIATSVTVVSSRLAGGEVHAISDAAIPVTAGYDVDKLFRAPTFLGSQGAASQGAASQGAIEPRAEAVRIIAHAAATARAATAAGVPDADRTYLADLVAARTGVSQAEARHRVDEFVAAAMDAEAKVKTSADLARKAASATSVYLALSLLVGAFIASVAAALGGRLRDEHL